MRKRGKLFRLMLGVLLAVLALSAGPAGAIYLPDGAVQDGTMTAGKVANWKLVDDTGACVTGIAADGTLTIDTTIKSRPDCLAKTFPSYTTQAMCGNTGNADGAHFWATTCVANDGTAISLDGLDRTATMCTQAAIKAGKTSGTWASACTSSWQYQGSDLASDNGFCYTRINVNTDPAYDTQAECNAVIPTGLFRYSSSICQNNYGIAGYANAALKRLDGTTLVAAAAFVDLSTYNTMGKCLLVGASWNNYTTMTGTASIATTPSASTVAAGVTTGNSDCLRCHNNTSQNNGNAERWKTSYLQTGHKNMLRKVTAGKYWAGADGLPYATDGTRALDVFAATYTIPAGFCSVVTYLNQIDCEAAGKTWTDAGDRPLFYLYGDWMAPNPTALYGRLDSDATATNGYSCAACHSTGWSNPDPTKGLCSISSKTTEAACTGAGGTWVASSGIQGTTGAEPAASFPGIGGVTGTWDRDGIICSRCHASTWPLVYNGTTALTSSHDLGSAVGGEATINLCFGCHQSPATDYTSNPPTGDKYLDPTMIPTGAGHGANWGREFNGHVLGNMFLNSPHAQYTGTITPNKLGKYDLVAGGTYGSSFAGSSCSGLSTVIKDGVVSKIETEADCTLAGGTWTKETRGTCATCHDVHQSLFDAAAEEPIKRECGVTCHATKADWSTIKHPMGVGTPIGDGSDPTAPCEICHMPKPTAEGFPMHLWRINTDAAYDTFPTQDQFNGTNGATKDRRAKMAADGTYTQAVWVDLDLACGQCHGGSAGASATKNSAPYFDKSYLSYLAAGMHSAAQSLPPTAAYTTLVTNTGLAVSFKDNSTDNNHQAQSTLAVSVNWGDGKVSSGVGGGTFTHTYVSPGTYTIVHTVRDTGARVASELIPIKIASTGSAVKYTLMVKARNYNPADLINGGTPIAGATVYLKKLTASGWIQVNYNYTNASGNFTFNNLIAGQTYKVVVYSTATDFNGAVAAKQGQVSLDPILMDKARIVQFIQGLPATNGPVGKLWAGTNGAAPAIGDVTP